MSSITTIVEGIDRSLATLREEISTLEATRDALVGTPKKRRTVSHETRRPIVKKRQPRRSVAKHEDKAEKKVEQKTEKTAEKRRLGRGQRAAQVISVIQNRPGVKTQEIVTMLGVDATQAYGITKRLEQQGRIEGGHKDGWRLVSQLRMPPTKKDDQA